MERRRVIVSGRVQGVFFRDTCRRLARANGLAGWVLNRDDDCVEAVFEGPTDAVERLVEWMHRGPVDADVTDVRVQVEPPEGLTGFAIR